MKDKKLPEISVKGTEQQLIEVETILIMLGYDFPDEGWNTFILNDYSEEITHITCYPVSCHVCYFFNTDTGKPYYNFDQISEIIDYVLNFKK